MYRNMHSKEEDLKQEKIKRHQQPEQQGHHEEEQAILIDGRIARKLRT
jgi:hypothetical protein